MEAKVQRVLIWMGPMTFVGCFGAFIVIAGWVPPTAPSDTAEETVRFYSQNQTSIKIGMVLAMASSALLVPWSVALSGQLKRIDGAKALSTTQMVSCALLSLEFITPIGIWMAAAFRVEDSLPEVTQALHDVGWILFLTVIWSVEVQMICVGVAVLIDKRPQPILPRWLGYLNLWVALLIVPAGLVLFFKHGAFAWNGLLGFWVPFSAYGAWMMATTWAVNRALVQQIAEGTEPG